MNNDLLYYLHGKLREGCRCLGLEAGIVSHVSGYKYQIVKGASELPLFDDGDVFDLGDTYCSEVVKTAATVAYHHVGSIQELKLHPVYQSLRLEAYIGTPIMLGDHLWGTVNFSSLDAKETPFAVDAVNYIESLAQELSDFITREPEDDSFRSAQKASLNQRPDDGQGEPGNEWGK